MNELLSTSDASTDNLIFNKTVGLTDSFAKIEKKAKAPARNESFEKVGPLAGKYLKARSDKERNALKEAITELGKNIPFEALLAPMEVAKSNKEILSCLLTLATGLVDCLLVDCLPVDCLLVDCLLVDCFLLDCLLVYCSWYIAS